MNLFDLTILFCEKSCITSVNIPLSSQNTSASIISVAIESRFLFIFVTCNLIDGAKIIRGYAKVPHSHDIFTKSTVETLLCIAPCLYARER